MRPLFTYPWCALLQAPLIFHKNQKAVGKGIKQCIEEGLVKREELFVTTKLWNVDWKPENAEKAAKQCLEDLQLDYIDLYLIHWPFFCNLPEEEEEHRQKGYFFDYNGLVPDSPSHRLGYNIENLKMTWAKLEELKERVVPSMQCHI